MKWGIETMYYDDDQDFDEDFEPDPVYSISLKNEILQLIGEYDVTYRSQQDTQRFLSQRIVDLSTFTHLKEAEIVHKIYVQASTHVSPFIANRVIAESFLFLFNHEKRRSPSYPVLSDWEEEFLVTNYMDLLCDNLTKDLARHMSSSHNGRFILVAIEDLLSWIRKIENRRNAYRRPDHRRAQVIDSDDDWNQGDMEEALYWIAAGEGEVDPSEERSISHSGSYDDYGEESFYDDYRSSLRFSAETLGLYLNLIIDSPDIEDRLKESVLIEATETLKLLTDTSVLSESMTRFKNMILEKSSGASTTSQVDKDLEFIRVVSTYSPVHLRTEIEGAYTSLSQRHLHEASFGPKGALGFVGAILLADFDESVQEFIVFGIEQVFEENWDPVTFENFVIAIVRDRSSISIHCWNEVSVILRHEHTWINNHKIAR